MENANPTGCDENFLPFSHSCAEGMNLFRMFLFWSSPHAFHFFSHATRRIFPINGFLYSTCTQTWRQTFGIWRFITTITELTICFSNYRKLHNNIIRCFNYLYILLKYHGGMLFPSFINIEWQISHGDIIFRFKKYNSLFGHYFLIWFYLCMK